MRTLYKANQLLVTVSTGAAPAAQTCSRDDDDDDGIRQILIEFPLPSSTRAVHWQHLLTFPRSPLNETS